jgi:putative phosphoribosyl transferase
MLFANRGEAGRQLGERLAGSLDLLGPDPIVLALPRGGVPVGFEVARRLAAPLDVFVVRKLGVPGREELAMGAIASGGVVVLSQDLIDSLGIAEAMVRRAIETERRELERRERLYRVRPPPQLADRGVILVDDGLATGATMRAAVAAVKKSAPARLTVAVPLSSWQAYEEIGAEVDAIVCDATPEPFYGVGAWYEDFSQTSDDEVRALLQAADEWAGEAHP